MREFWGYLLKRKNEKSTFIENGMPLRFLAQLGSWPSLRSCPPTHLARARLTRVEDGRRVATARRRQRTGGAPTGPTASRAP
jgi:hypothetical protein